MPTVPKNPLHPHQVEILRALVAEGIPATRSAIYRHTSFKNWIGKYLGTPRNSGRYPQSLYERGLVDVEDQEGAADESGHRCFFFYITREGRAALKAHDKPAKKAVVPKKNPKTASSRKPRAGK
jgi:hypothetical protein